MVLSENDPRYQQCSFSVMDNIADPNITFDEKGISNYYYEYLEAVKLKVFKGDEGKKKVDEIIATLKNSGKNKKYDCIIGVSGGVDSTYLALKAKEFGLRVLCVHFDNGWDSELAVKNIENIVNKCGFDLYSYVINWEEFKDVQLSYFKAGVIDIEAVSDIAISLSLNKICAEYDLKYILEGNNVVTEQTLPYAWVNKDLTNLLNIHAKYGTIPLKSFPVINRWKKNIHDSRNSYTSIPFLNYIEYNKAREKEEIIEKLNWIDYGGKHYESVFTRFYQGYILPLKFKVDKRKAHLSNLIFSGQITKEDAINELKTPIYPFEQQVVDKEFVLKKLGFTEEAFQEYMDRPVVDHNVYGSSKSLSDDYPILKLLKPIKRLFIK